MVTVKFFKQHLPNHIMSDLTETWGEAFGQVGDLDIQDGWHGSNLEIHLTTSPQPYLGLNQYGGRH